MPLISEVHRYIGLTSEMLKININYSDILNSNRKAKTPRLEDNLVIKRTRVYL